MGTCTDHGELDSGVGSCSARVEKKRLFHRARLSRSAAPRNRPTSAAAAFQSMAPIFSISLAITQWRLISSGWSFQGPA